MLRQDDGPPLCTDGTLPSTVTAEVLRAAYDACDGDVAVALVACGARGASKADAAAMAAEVGGPLTQSDFVEGALRRRRSGSADAAALFRLCGPTSAAGLTKVDLRKLSAIAGGGQAAPDDQIDEVLWAADADGDGCVSLAEFVAATKGQHQWSPAARQRRRRTKREPDGAQQLLPALLLPEPVQHRACPYDQVMKRLGSSLCASRLAKSFGTTPLTTVQRRAVRGALGTSTECRAQEDFCNVGAAEWEESMRASTSVSSAARVSPSMEQVLALTDWIAAEWEQKAGTVVDELLDNLVGPEEVAKGGQNPQVLALAAQHLQDAATAGCAKYNGAQLLVLRLYTMAGPDIDELMTFGDVPDSDGWAQYKQERTPERNEAIFSAINWALRTAGEPPPVPCPPDADTPQYATLRHWIKFVVLLMALAASRLDSAELPEELTRGLAALPPPVVAGHGRLREGGRLRWSAPSSCAVDPAVSMSYIRGEAANATKGPCGGAVLFRVHGVQRGVYLKPISKYPNEEELLVPPFTSLTVQSCAAAADGGALPAGTVVLDAAFDGTLAAGKLEGLCTKAVADSAEADRYLADVAEWMRQARPDLGVVCDDDSCSELTASGVGRSPRVREVKAGGPADGVLRARDVILSARCGPGRSVRLGGVQELDAFRAGLGTVGATSTGAGRSYPPVTLRVRRSEADSGRTEEVRVTVTPTAAPLCPPPQAGLRRQGRRLSLPQRRSSSAGAGRRLQRSETARRPPAARPTTPQPHRRHSAPHAIHNVPTAASRLVSSPTPPPPPTDTPPDSPVLRGGLPDEPVHSPVPRDITPSEAATSVTPPAAGVQAAGRSQELGSPSPPPPPPPAAPCPPPPPCTPPQMFRMPSRESQSHHPQPLSPSSASAPTGGTPTPMQTPLLPFGRQLSVTSAATARTPYQRQHTAPSLTPEYAVLRPPILQPVTPRSSVSAATCPAPLFGGEGRARTPRRREKRAAASVVSPGPTPWPSVRRSGAAPSVRTRSSEHRTPFRARARLPPAPLCDAGPSSPLQRTPSDLCRVARHFKPLRRTQG